MINFLKFHGATTYKNKKIYLNSIPLNEFPIFISSGEHSKAYFDLRENKFCGLSWKYGQDLKAKAEEEKEQIEEWLKKQEAKQAEALAINEAVQKEESAKQAVKAERLKVLKARAKAKENNVKGFHDLFLRIYEKFFDDDKEALRKTSEAINHGIDYFTLRDETLKEKIKILKNKKYFIESVIPLISNQLNKVKTFDDLLSYVHTGDFMEMSKEVISFICSEETEEQKANEESKEESIITGESSKPLVTVDTEIKSDKPKTESQRKYRESEKGKATRANYLQSEAGKQAREKANRKYRESEKGQQSQKQAYNKYKDSEKGKQARLKAVRAYRERQKQKQLISTVVD